MCTLVAGFGTRADRPLVIAFNRDERLDRPTVAPGVLPIPGGQARVIGGRDAEAGGTWFAVSETGLLVGILNRREDQAPAAGRRSRGLLVLDLVSAGSVEAARAALAGDRREYNPYWVVFGDAGALWLATGGGEIAEVKFEPWGRGVHVLTSGPRLELTAMRRERVLRGIHGAFELPQEGLEERIKVALSEHDESEPVAGPCVHLPPYGTKSSTIVSLGANGRPARYLHAEGHPCTTPYAEI